MALPDFRFRLTDKKGHSTMPITKTRQNITVHFKLNTQTHVFPEFFNLVAINSNHGPL